MVCINFPKMVKSYTSQNNPLYVSNTPFLLWLTICLIGSINDVIFIMYSKYSPSHDPVYIYNVLHRFVTAWCCIYMMWYPDSLLHHAVYIMYLWCDTLDRRHATCCFMDLRLLCADTYSCRSSVMAFNVVLLRQVIRFFSMALRKRKWTDFTCTNYTDE